MKKHGENGLLPFRPGRGGKRKGAGRKPNGAVAGVSHLKRAALASRFPVHVTVKVGRGLPRLRRRRERKVLMAAFAAGCDRNGFRLCHYAILNDHIHFLVEAKERTTLSRGLQGLLVRIARALNKLWGRRGTVFADRYHDRILKTPREVKNAIRYVLGNGKKHERDGRQVRVGAAADVFSSAPWFDGYRETVRWRGLEATVRPVTDSKTWMLTKGWRRHGLLSVHELPASA
jgi:REP element-mobilizing transposase RayT